VASKAIGIKSVHKKKIKKFKTEVNVVETLSGVKDNVAYEFMIEVVMLEEH
jgi:hypothetical protein